MSHTQNLKASLNDALALKKAADRLGLVCNEGTHKLYETTETGIAIKLKGWRYDVVIKKDGEIAYDNYGGEWGKMEELNALVAWYSFEKAKIEAIKKGHRVVEGKTATGNPTLKVLVA